MLLTRDACDDIFAESLARSRFRIEIAATSRISTTTTAHHGSIFLKGICFLLGTNVWGLLSRKHFACHYGDLLFSWKCQENRVWIAKAWPSGFQISSTCFTVFVT